MENAVARLKTGKLLSDPNPEKSGRVMQAMFQMKKIDIKSWRKHIKVSNPDK
jgi:predicted 3-demethylubiquinone-9 3-methyltransferase (glyoxalase superfamily)